MTLTKPTVSATIVYSIPPIVLLWFGWVDMHSPEWDTNDSGAVQGYAIFALASLASFVTVLVGFPSTAKLLGSSFTSRKWVYSNILVVTFVAFVAAVFFSITAGYTSFLGILINAVVLTVLLFVINSVLVAPAMFIWLRVADTSHNKARQYRPAGWTR